MAPIAGNQKKTGWKAALLVTAMVLFFVLGALISEVATFAGAVVIAFGAVLAVIETTEIDNEVDAKRNADNVAAAVVGVGAAIIAGGASTAAFPIILSFFAAHFG